MNPRLLLCLAITVLMFGCSKNEDSSGVRPAAPAPAAPPDKAAVNAPVSQKAVSDVRAAVNSATSNAVSSAGAATASAANGANVTPPAAPTDVHAVIDRVIQPPATTTPDSGNSGGASTAAPTGNPASLAGFSTDQLDQGLKEALGKGLQHAVSLLGQPGGFLSNATVKIPLPDKLQTVEKGLRAIGQGKVADECITTMNQAAEQAVPVAADVFVNSLKNMSVGDAKGILTGAPDSATQFFRRTTGDELTKRFQPIVQQAMTKCGVTAAYEQVLSKAKGVSPFFSAPSLDLDAYVTGKAMDGLFKMIAAEEKRIRENPVARSTDLLKSVFGALQKGT